MVLRMKIKSEVCALERSYSKTRGYQIVRRSKVKCLLPSPHLHQREEISAFDLPVVITTVLIWLSQEQKKDQISSTFEIAMIISTPSTSHSRTDW